MSSISSYLSYSVLVERSASPSSIRSDRSFVILLLGLILLHVPITFIFFLSVYIGIGIRIVPDPGDQD